MKKILAFYKHNFGFVTGLLLTPFVLWYAFGCQAQVVSLTIPGKMVDRSELVSEVDAFLAIAEARFSNLDRQDLVRNTMFNSLSELIVSNPTSPAGVALFVVNLLGIGAVIDNARKRTLIDVLKKHQTNVSSSDNSVPKTS